MQKTKILYLITSLDTLGPATALVNIATRLNPDLFQVQFCCCDSNHRGPLQSALSDNNIPIHTLNTIGPLDIRAILKLVKLLNREKFDILHSRLPRADFYARLAGALSDVPIVVNNICDIYTAHFQTWHHPFVGKLYYWSNKFTTRLADFYVANANGVRDDLIQNVGIPGDKVLRIYNGIDSKRFNVNQEIESQTRSQLGLVDDTLVVGTIAKLNR
ncbi:MAG: glycosyltransferase, partial [Verrucomicrobiota bacterium]|nr:glycosyltransferase [Verrucomicrobiota bacterium]